MIERAVAETDHTIVIVYDAPESTDIPLPVRAGWIRNLYPSVEVLEAWDGPTVVGETPEVMAMHEEYLLTLLAGRTITHFYSSEFYGDHVSKALGAKDCRVDEHRTAIPTSGTAIRSNPFVSKQFLSPEVYQDLITKVVFLGAPSTGKTSLAEALAQQLNTAWMPEYGREYWIKNHKDRRLTREQLVELAEEHIRREEAKVIESNQFLFVDTDATTTYMFSLYYHASVHPRLAELAANTLHRYDLFFLCGDEIPYNDTWDRSGVTNRTVFQKRIRADLLQRSIPFIDITGSLATRVQTVQGILQHFNKFNSLGNYIKKAQ